MPVNLHKIMDMKRIFSFIRKKKAHVMVLRFKGVLADGKTSHKLMAPLIDRAFRSSKIKAVALVINSPGGSPVQSSLITTHIRRLAEKKAIPVYSFVEDVAASGGYWLALAGDEIYVDKSSIVGSIGVIYSGFGLHEFIERHGIERRVHTAGESKSFLDPFKPEKPSDVKKIKDIQTPIHEAFIEHTKERRKDRLGNDSDMFSGKIWVGQSAVDVGLVDGVGHLIPIIEEKLKSEVKFIHLDPKQGIFAKLRMGIINDFLNSIEERSIWARFGL